MIDSNPESNSVRRLLTSDDMLQLNKHITLPGKVEQCNCITSLLSFKNIEKKNNNLT